MTEDEEFIRETDDIRYRADPFELTGWEVVIFELADEEDAG